MLPSLREHVQKHTACRFDSPLWQAPTWTEVANGYLDLAQWGPPPWTELQWATLRNVIELVKTTSGLIWVGLFYSSISKAPCKSPSLDRHEQIETLLGPLTLA